MTPTLTIIHVVHTPRYSGAELLVFNLSKRQSRLGFRVVVCSFAPPHPDFLPLVEELRTHGVLWHCPEQMQHGLARLWFLRQVFQMYPKSTIFAHSALPAIYSRLARANGVIPVLHDATEDDFRDKKLRLAEHFLTMFTKVVVAVSAGGARHYNERFPGRKAIVVANGIDLTAFAPRDGRRIASRSNLGEEILKIIQIGRIAPEKNQLLSVKSMDLVRRSFGIERFCLAFAGLVEDKTYKETLEATILSLGLENHIHFLGPRSDVSQLLADSDVYLMPSTREAHSVALLEALASGIPIVCSAIDSFRFASSFEGVAVIKDNDPVAYASAIKSALEEQRRFAREMSHFSIDKTAEKYIEIAHGSLKGT